MAQLVKRLVPMFDRVLVEQAKAQATSRGGIHLPETARQRIDWGKVVAVGPGARDSKGNIIPMSLKEGDNVMLSSWSNQTVEVGGKELVMVRESEVLGKVEFE